MNVRFCFIFLALLISLPGFSQEPVPQSFQLHVEGSISNMDDTPLSGASVQVMQGGKVIKNILTDGSGFYSFDLPLNADYSINVSKPGCVTKKFVVSTRGVPPERAQTKFGTIEASLSLMEKIDGIDYSVLNQPMNKYNYNPDKENFEYDKLYLEQMQAAQQNLLAQIKAAQEKLKELERNYQSAIKTGDKAFQKNDWTAAKAAYMQASGLKPNETWPKDQMVQIDKIIKEQEALNKKKEEDAKKAAEAAAKAKAEAELNAKYAAALKKGDDAFAAKNWAAAKMAYNEALGLKPGEQYPKDKLAAIDKAIADETAAKSKAELDAKYTAAIKKGDDAFAAKNWAAAKMAYNEALGFKPAEQYPKDKLAAIDKAIADEATAKSKAELDAKYSAAIKKGDDAFAAKNWAAAKTAYNEALGIKPSEQYPKDKLAAIDKAIADENAAKSKAELDAKYIAAIKKGDDAFAAKNWAAAKTAYNEALGIKPSEQYPKDKLAAIDKAIADENAAKSKAELDAKYSAAIKKGDDAFAAKNWTIAKAGYTEALAIKSNEQYPKDRIAAIDKAIADEAAAKAKAEADAKNKAELEAKYSAAIKKGDDAFAAKNWALAKTAYNEALGIKPSEQYPKDKLAAIDKAIADENAAKSKAELDAKYSAAIKKGDDAFAAKNWTAAKIAYNEALGIKPGEQYPKDKLAAIDKAIADENAAKSKAELDAKYSAAIKKGDDAFAAKNWALAKTAYNEALGIKPSEQYPKDKLAAIDKAIGDEAAAKAKAEADAKNKAELEAKYAAAIKKGDDGFAKKDWLNAKAAFTEASGLKPAEQYPKDKLAAIDKAIADEAAAKAKTDAEAKAKAELEAKYAAAIKKGDEAFAKKEWPTARTGYNEASGLKPAEQYPKNQLAAIDKAMADEKSKMDAESKAKAEAELNVKYQEAIKQGDDAFGKKEWNNSKNAYNKALGFKPAEKYPKDQIAIIDKNLADEAAMKAKAEADAKNKAEMEAKYAAAIKKGDDAFAAKNWSLSKSGYNDALTIKPAEQYPKDKLLAIDKAIADENANKSKAEIDAKYTAAVKRGDEAFAKKDWSGAKSGYNDALTIKPAEQYPKDKLLAIDKAIADENANKSKAEIDAKYTAAVKRGDEAFAKKDWANAKLGYNDAIAIKPGEQYPKDKLIAIDKAINDELLNKSKSETEAKYAAAIKMGDGAFSKKDWPTAKGAYNEALIIKPGEQYPKDKLAEIEKIIADEIAKNDAAKSAAEIKAKYDAAIKKADELFAKKNWADAKSTYYEALGFMPDEKYPKMQIGAINKIQNEGAASSMEQKYKEAITKADNYFNSKVYRESKKYYEEALTYKGGDAYAKGRLIELEKLLNSDNAVKTDAHLKALLAKYKPGVTEEIINGTGVVIIQRVVVKDNNAWVYQKKVFDWGGIAYFRDGAPITELIFENETKP